MIALALLASHLVGDFILQTRWQSAGKFGWTRDAIVFRLTHCMTYTLAFGPVVGAYSWRGWTSPADWRGGVFLIALFVLHFLTDAQRFPSTLGDWIGWQLDRHHYDEVNRGKIKSRHPRYKLQPLPPNPWPALPICIDQTLHVVQFAALGWLLA